MEEFGSPATSLAVRSISLRRRMVAGLEPAPGAVPALGAGKRARGVVCGDVVVWDSTSPSVDLESDLFLRLNCMMIY